MPWPSSIYVASMWPIFHFQSHFHYNYSYNLIETDILVFAHFEPGVASKNVAYRKAGPFPGKISWV